MAADPQRHFYVRVTAAHVLDQIKEDTATLHFRQASGSGFTRLPVSIPIRSAGAPLWEKHPDVDIAAMFVRVPTVADVKLVSMSLLATDQTLQTLEVHTIV
jgi:hypothetical protein